MIPDPEIILDVEDSGIPSTENLVGWAKAALENDPAQLCIRIVDRDEMQSLNDRYAGKAYATNVLSFPMQNSDTEIIEGFPDTLTMKSLGDIAICAPVVLEEAEEQGKLPGAHWAHMVVHGVLHLRGFDHQLEDQAQAMESKETGILSELGFPNPYADVDHPETQSGADVVRNQN